jgi:hemerythrin
MFKFTWNQTMSVGIAEFDDQHRELLDATNRLIEGMETGRPQTELGEILDEIVRITRTHFESEERVFATHKYPGAVVHKGEHDQLLSELVALQKYFAEGKLQLSPKNTRFFIDALEHHVTGTDRNYTNFLNFCGVH